MDDPERIWLEPGEGFNPNYGRTWCQADDWEGEGIEYIRADLAAAHTRAAVERERAACERAAQKTPPAHWTGQSMRECIVLAIAARKAQP